MSSAHHTDRQASREYDAAAESLAHAEQLVEILGQAQRDVADDSMNTYPSNPYLDDAFQRAVSLRREMADNLADVMDRWTPEQCGL